MTVGGGSDERLAVRRWQGVWDRRIDVRCTYLVAEVYSVPSIVDWSLSWYLDKSCISQVMSMAIGYDTESRYAAKQYMSMGGKGTTMVEARHQCQGMQESD